jgi:hypothetical protein
MAILGCMAMDNLFLSQENDLNLRKQVDHANEVKVMSSMHGWHIPTMIYEWTKYGVSGLYGNGETDIITRTSTAGERNIIVESFMTILNTKYSFFFHKKITICILDKAKTIRI